MSDAKPRRLPYWLKYSLMLAFAFFASLAILRSSLHNDFPELNSTQESSRQNFADLQLIDKNADSTRLSSFRGKVVLLSFWASWCAPCIEELPHFADLSRQYQGELAVVPVNQDDDPTAADFIRKFWAENEIPFKTFYDPGHELAKMVELEVLPTNFVLDRKGKLVFASHGANDWHSPEAKKFLDDLIREK